MNLQAYELVKPWRATTKPAEGATLSDGDLLVADERAAAPRGT
jgi:hypothetical protein